jgi:hypothetical protein
MTVITRPTVPVLFGFFSLFLSLFSVQGLIVRSMWIVVIHVVYVVSANLTVKQLRAMKRSQNTIVQAFEHQVTLSRT